MLLLVLSLLASLETKFKVAHFHLFFSAQCVLDFFDVQQTSDYKTVSFLRRIVTLIVDLVSWWQCDSLRRLLGLHVEEKYPKRSIS